MQFINKNDMSKERKNFKRDLSIVCSKDDLRPVMQSIIFHKGNAVCTNASVLVRQSLLLHGFTDVEIERLEGYSIHKDVFKEVYKYKEVRVEDGHFVCFKGAVKAKFEIEKLDGVYPKYEAVIPDESKINPVSNFGLKFEFLDMVKKVIMSDLGAGEFQMHGQSSAILVKTPTLEWADETILIMPYSLNV